MTSPAKADSATDGMRLRSQKSVGILYQVINPRAYVGTLPDRSPVGPMCRREFTYALVATHRLPRLEWVLTLPILGPAIKERLPAGVVKPPIFRFSSVRGHSRDGTHRRASTSSLARKQKPPTQPYQRLVA
jgi:hypothetical protein